MPTYRKRPRGLTRKTDRMREYSISYSDIADWFNYSSANSFNGSSAKMDIIRGIDSVIRRVESYLEDRSGDIQ